MATELVGLRALVIPEECTLCRSTTNHSAPPFLKENKVNIDDWGPLMNKIIRTYKDSDDQEQFLKNIQEAKLIHGASDLFIVAVYETLIHRDCVWDATISQAILDTVKRTQTKRRK